MFCRRNGTVILLNIERARILRNIRPFTKVPEIEVRKQQFSINYPPVRSLPNKVFKTIAKIFAVMTDDK
jgi:hypothetical protein